MSHHFDTPTAREDPRLNLCDLYLFADGSDRTVMAMTVNPAADPAGDSPLFRDEAIYQFRFDTDGDATEDVTFKVRFGAVRHDVADRHVQDFEVRRAIGRSDGFDGDLIATSTTGDLRDLAGVRVFAGAVHDAFAGNGRALETYEAAFAQGRYEPQAFDQHDNLFEGRNIAAIVLELPTELIGAGRINAWATISLFGHAPEIQVARWGLPLLTHLFIRDDEMREAFNRSTPSDDNSIFLGHIADVIRDTTLRAGTTGDPQAYAQRVLDRLGTLTLPYLLGSVASFDFTGFNGRTLDDDVMDVMLTLTTNSALGDGAAPKSELFTTEFPYFVPAVLQRQ